MKSILVLLLSVPLLCFAQDFQFRQEFDTIPVEINGWHPVAPWTGGDSETAPEFCDIDADGDYDCFIGNTGCRITHYENIGSGTNPQFKYRTRFFGEVIIDSIYYGRLDPAFVDIDDDGDFDLFSSCAKGLVHFWENQGTPQVAEFIHITDSLEYIDELGRAHIDFTDIDNDGDYDMFIGDNIGRLNYYENVGTPDSFDFEEVTSYFDSIDVGDKAAPCFVDIDADGDDDLFIGEKYGKIWFYRNDSDSTGLHFTYITDYYNNIDVSDAASPDFVDLEGDGDFDLVIGRDVSYPNTPVYGDVVFYTNIGTPQAAEWELLSEQYLTWDIGGSLGIHGCDIDGDFDYDLFIMLQYCSPDYFAYYENIGNSQEAYFLRITDNYQDIHENGSNPCFADIDEDLDYDLFLGEGVIPNPPYPGLHLFENIGTPQNAVFNLVSENLVPWNYDVCIRPALVDIDADGDKDLFLTDNDGVFYFWENIGSASHPQFSNNPVLNWQGISLPGGLTFCFADIDNDDDDDLFFNHPGYNLFWFYENIGTPQNANMQFITQTFLGEDIELLSPGAVDFVDIDDDGDGDFIFSGNRGGMMFFRNITGDTTGVKSSKQRNNIAQVQLRIHPNPANSSAHISFISPQPLNANLTIYNLLGEKVATLTNGIQPWGSCSFQWNASGLASGVYLVSLEAGGNFSQARKVMLVK